MKIAVISDTHIRREEEWISAGLEKALKEVGFIVHCGDFEIYSAYTRFKELGELVAVHGNMDRGELKRKLPAQVTFAAAGWKIGVIHGDGPPAGLEARVAAALPGVDVILYGHSHRPRNEVINGVLFFNPGSPTDRRFALYNSYGIIELGPDGPRGEIIRLGGGVAGTL